MKTDNITNNSEKQIKALPLSFQQNRAYILHQKSYPKPLLNMCYRLDFDSIISIDALTVAVRELTKRYDILNTRLLDIDGEIMQTIWDGEEIDIVLHKANSLTIDEEVYRVAIEPFTILNSSLFRVHIWHIESSRTVMLLAFHHILADGLSVSYLISDLCDMYNQACGGKLIRSEKLGKSYSLYGDWQLKQMRDGSFKVHEDYWKTVFDENYPYAELPRDFPKPSEQTYNGSRIHCMLDYKTKQEIAACCMSNRWVPFTFMLGIYILLLYRYCNQSRFRVGTVFAGRQSAVDFSPVGFYSNTVAINVELNKDETVRQLINKLQKKVDESYDHQMFPIEYIAQNLSRDTSRPLLFSVMYILHKSVNCEKKFWGNASLSSFRYVEMPCSQYDLTFHIHDLEDGYDVVFEYCSDLFEPAIIHSMSDYFREIINSILLYGVDQNIGNIPHLDINSDNKLLSIIRGLQKYFDSSRKIDKYIEDIARYNPLLTAVYDNGKIITYRELDYRASQIAAALSANGIGNGDLVAVYMDRSAEYVITIIGIWKAGAAFLPLNTVFPQKRIEYMIKDSGCKAIVYSKNCNRASFPSSIDVFEYSDLSTDRICISDFPVSKSSLAYVIYTSGSTGTAKGVKVGHIGLINLISLFRDEWHIKPGDRILQFSCTSFDASIWEICMALTTGACLYIVPESTKYDTALFECFINDNKITLATLPPPFLSLLCPDKIHTLRMIVAAGSESRPNDVLKWLDKVVYINAYGPTETTICATYWQADRKSVESKKVYIGKPINNSSGIILHSDGQIAPIGAIGELCISGVHLALGYQNADELTKEKFIQNPLDPGELLYRTGDLARCSSEGQLEYKGRCDRQIKIDGYRIEPGEIENAILNSGMVSQAVVVVKNSDEHSKLLYTYYTSKNQIDTEALRYYLMGVLPNYMVPSHYIRLNYIPENANGKIDYDSLPLQNETCEMKLSLPTNETQKKLIDIWHSVLNTDNISLDESFFELGGTSLLLMKMHRIIETEFKVSLPVSALFKYYTVEMQADYLDFINKKRIEPESTILPGNSKKRSHLLSLLKKMENLHNEKK